MLMPEGISRRSSKSHAENARFQFLDPGMFLAGRKELGEETGIGWLDAEKSKTEFWADLLSYYGLWNPFTYQKLTVSPLPDDPVQGTSLMLPDSSGGAMIPAPDTLPVLGQAGEDTKLIPPQVGGEGGLKTPDYIKLSEELGTKIEYEGGICLMSLNAC